MPGKAAANSESDGCQAEFVCVPDAMANLAPVPDVLSDEQALMCPDIMSTGFSGPRAARSGSAIGSQCAERLRTAQLLGADHVIDFKEVDPVEEILRLTQGRGVKGFGHTDLVACS